MLNGIHHGLAADTYHGLDRLSASALKRLMRSPMAYRWAKDHPTEPSAAMALGTAAHTAILEPHKLLTDYALWDGGTRRGKAWDEFRAAHADRHILTRDEFDAAQAMRDAVRGFAPAMRYLAIGEAEVTMLWDCEGHPFKCRADWVTTIDGRPVIVDLKTTRDASPRRFGNDAFRLGYHVQFALYADAWEALTGQAPAFVVIAVESKAPHEPAVFRVPDDVLEQGRDDYRRLIATLDECATTNHWPPMSEAEQELTLPSYAYGTADDDLSDVLDLSA